VISRHLGLLETALSWCDFYTGTRIQICPH